MYITVRFIDATGTPLNSLTPTLNIWELETNNKVVDSVSMDFVAEGWYKYLFSVGDLKKNYVASCDGGASLSLDIRYKDSAIDMSQALVEKVERGRWKIFNNQMVFYDDDNVTPILTFDLKDASGQPTMSDPTERYPVA